MSEVGCQRSEDGSRRSEDRGQMSEHIDIGFRISNYRFGKAERICQGQSAWCTALSAERWQWINLNNYAMCRFCQFQGFWPQSRKLLGCALYLSILQICKKNKRKFKMQQIILQIKFRTTRPNSILLARFLTFLLNQILRHVGSSEFYKETILWNLI